MNLHEIKEGLQELRRGEGVIWAVNVAKWSTSPVPQNITLIREQDSQDVTALFTGTTMPVVDGCNIIFPEVTVPTDAALGYYRLDFPFEGGSFSPGIPFIRFLVKE